MKIIAELCQNHNGDESIVERMVDEALGGGATHIKLQTIYSSDLTFRPQFEEGLIVNGKVHSIKRPWINEYKRLKDLELNDKIYTRFVESCKQKGAVPLTTCFSINRINEIVDQGFEEIKVASYDCASFPLIRNLAKNFKYLYISTGASFNEEIKKTASIMNEEMRIPFSFLHCITLYPTPLENLNLSRIDWLRKYTSSVGFSDHTSPIKTGVKSTCAAIYFGADVLERHFTILDPSQTKDGPVSMNKKDLKTIVEFSKFSKSEQEEWLNEQHSNWKLTFKGIANRNLSHEELLNRDYYRGRFASRRSNSDAEIFTPRYNWEEI